MRRNLVAEVFAGRSAPSGTAGPVLRALRACVVLGVIFAGTLSGSVADDHIADRDLLDAAREAMLQGSDPGAFVAEWPGALNFTLASVGASDDKGVTTTLKMEKLDGTLRQREAAQHLELGIGGLAAKGR